jgi:hypothetical protein
LILCIDFSRTTAYLTCQQFIRCEEGELSQAAITRPIEVASATATLAAKLAALPATSSAPPLRPDRESADAANDHPFDRQRRDAATHPGWPCLAMCMCMCR